jgi:CRISPR system Cascade subunit CasA
MFTFNLLEEKWLPCVMTDNALRDMNLREVLTDAPNVRELVGDSPPVTIALHRLLLAILHRALSAPRDTDEWNEIRETGNFDRAKIENYFDKWKSRFDLFDANHPFYQSVSARENIQSGAIIQLYFQGKNNATLFDHSTTGIPNAVSAAQAARFLVAFQSFDFGGIKADGSAQTAPLLQSAIALIKGENLFETLLFNLHRYDGVNPFTFKLSQDLPAWERDEETQAVERLPDGYVDLLTWQARRINLQPEADENGETIVKNTVIMRGYSMPRTVNRHAKETMVAFRASKTEGFFPVGFSETRALWRNSLSLFQTVKDQTFRPKMLDWLDDLVGFGSLSRASGLPIEFYGLAADKGKLLFWQKESFYLPLAYLDDAELLQILRNAIEFAEGISASLRSGIKELAIALTDKPDNAANFQAMPMYWSTLELAFQNLLSNLPNDTTTAMSDWCKFVLDTARDAFRQTADSLSGAAREQKAIVEAEAEFNKQRNIFLSKNENTYGIYLPKGKSKGGNQ